MFIFSSATFFKIIKCKDRLMRLRVHLRRKTVSFFSKNIHNYRVISEVVIWKTAGICASGISRLDGKMRNTQRQT